MESAYRYAAALLALAFVLFLAGGVADYELQAYQHGWKPTGIADMNYRAPKLADPWDWIPRDAWHIAQTTRNTADKAGAVIAFLALAGLIPDAWTSRLRSWMYLAILIVLMFAVAAIARGASFSLLYRLLN